METRNKMKYILDDIYDLERQLRDYEDIRKKLDKRKEELGVAIEEYLSPKEFKLYDKVKVIKNYTDNPMDDFEIYENAVGTIIDVDADWDYPYLIQFDDEDVEKHSREDGRSLWEGRQLESTFL